ncbi:hypothetical protein TCAL_00009 [Tigriopus californicus]|uniref:Uncharacterized protein n=1 Tax=Tigriopus californicus TaxID=6832 RepID=A0A553PH62_TIGCA|nr:uncharacterized protein LOC131880308 [Tigriopus californicus]TRY77022.1 hypothetical protein TCAL_00009 [Tigriopus californicus]|eukprot:TCALIF_00009-PA protein Name:"Protein of unknown function" AED:0.02 eAED:0.02 QI:0/1/0.8/1/0.25/0.6/5/309/195
MAFRWNFWIMIVTGIVSCLIASALSMEPSDHEEHTDFERSRRIPYMYPQQYRSGPFFEYDNEDEDDNPKEEELVRQLRIPYYYPKYGGAMNYFKRFRDNPQEKKRSLKKRGIPYFYPNMKYNFWPEYKRFMPAALKRTTKRNLGQIFSEDLSAFGYDKRSPWEDDKEFLEEWENSLASSDENQEERKRKRKRVVV